MQTAYYYNISFAGSTLYYHLIKSRAHSRCDAMDAIIDARASAIIPSLKILFDQVERDYFIMHARLNFLLFLFAQLYSTILSSCSIIDNYPESNLGRLKIYRWSCLATSPRARITSCGYAVKWLSRAFKNWERISAAAIPLPQSC